MKTLFALMILFPASASAVMSAASCATEVVAKLKPLNANITGAAETQLVTAWTEICKALIDHIKNNALVTVTGVTTGAGTTTGTVQ